MTQSRLHPLVATAAGSVVLVSLLGAAAITGILPTSHSSVAPGSVAAVPTMQPTMQPVAAVQPTMQPGVVAVAPIPTMTPTMAPAPAAVHHTPRTPAPNKHKASPSTMQASNNYCDNCGTVVAVNTISRPLENTSGIGAVTGAVLGGVLGNQVGGGNGRKIATVAGAIGGGFAGNAVERQTRSNSSYEVRVRMEDGSMRSFSHGSEPGWRSGDKVRIENGQLTSRA